MIVLEIERLTQSRANAVLLWLQEKEDRKLRGTGSEHVS